VQVKRDTESSNFSNFWIPAFAGMTVFMALSAIMTQSHSPGFVANKVSQRERIDIILQSPTYISKMLSPKTSVFFVI
jgi:hypothetical protein